jgi:hypothetical protein
LAAEIIGTARAANPAGSGGAAAKTAEHSEQLQAGSAEYMHHWIVVVTWR